MKIGFFQELDKDGNLAGSSIRLQMFITMFFSFFVIGYQVYVNQVDIVLATLLLSSAFVPKVVSKFAETMAKK